MTPLDVGDAKKRKQKEREKEEHRAKTHELVYGDVYMNDLARDAAYRGGAPLQVTYPEGAVIVRERLKDGDSSVAELLAVMIKREKDFNRTANDWEFLLINGDVTQIKKRQKTGECQACHASRSRNDFVMSDYKQSLQIDLPAADPPE